MTVACADGADCNSFISAIINSPVSCAKVATCRAKRFASNRLMSEADEVAQYAPIEPIVEKPGVPSRLVNPPRPYHGPCGLPALPFRPGERMHAPFNPLSFTALTAKAT